MKILLLVQSLTIGGLPNHVLDLARALADAGDSVVLVHGSAEVPAHLDLTGVTLMALRFDQPQAVARAVQAWAPDVAHIHLCSDQPVLDQLRATGIPLVRSFHDYTSMCLRRGRRRFPGDRCQRALSQACALYGCALGAPAPGSRLPQWRSISAKLVERETYRQFDAAVVGSRHMARVLLDNGFDAQRVQLVPYFCRFDAFASGALPAVPKAPGTPGVDRPLSLLFAGQAVAGKGLKLLVRALAGVAGDWTLTTVASGPDLAPAQAMAQRAGIAHRIDFKPWLPQAALQALYGAADLLVIPSVWDDPGPLVGLEALSMGTPVLAFPVGGIPDYAIDGRTGFLAESVSVAALAATLRRALAGGGDLAELGRRGRDLVAEVHGRRRHVARMHAVYEQAMRAPARAANQPSVKPAPAWP